jgi:uncharacterized membrane protein
MFLVLLAKSGGLVIDWTQMPTYNTIMSVAAGAGLLSLLMFARQLTVDRETDLGAWAIAFAVPGFILTVTGLHMTLTWPMAKYFPFDNIIFGETSVGFGVLLLGAAFYLWTRGSTAVASGETVRFLARAAQPLSLFTIGMGLSLIAIGAAGMYNKLFAAPPEEPISGMFAGYPWIEATFISGMFALVGLGALLLPLALRELARGAKYTPLQKLIGVCWGLTGVGFLVFGALNFFTHIGLIVNTMPAPQ